MKYTGHKTRAIFKRYAIVDETMMREEAEKLSAYYDRTRAEPERKVVPLETSQAR